MPDPDKPMEEPKLGKGRRRSAVIDLQAEEVRTVGEPPTDTATEPSGDPKTSVAPDDPRSETSAPETVATDTSAAAPQEPVAATHPEPEAHAAEPAQEESASRVEPIHVPPAPEPARPSLALPLVAAAGLGLIFGGVGGAVAPRFMGADEAESAKIAIIERTQQQIMKDQAGLAAWPSSTRFARPSRVSRRRRPSAPPLPRLRRQRPPLLLRGSRSASPGWKPV